MREQFRLLILLLIAAGMFFLRLDSALLEPEEVRYAEIPREMLAADEWVVPLYHGQPYFDKPPLLYWLVKISYSLFGVHDWAARLVPGCCGFLMVLTTYGWGRRIFDVRCAFLGALTLSLMSRFIYLGRFVATDTVVSLCVVMALASLHIAVNAARHRDAWWLLGGASCGLGLLAKGPVALVLVGVPMAAHLLLCARALRPSGRETACFSLAMLAIAAPWYLAMMREPGFTEYFFWKQHVLRFVEPFDHSKPFWFFLPDFAFGTLPWSPLLIALAARLYRDRHEISRRRSPDVMLPLLAALWCLIFFSISGCKRVGYILPAFAPCALAIGFEMDKLLVAADSAAKRWMHALLIAAVAGMGAAGAGLALFAYWPTLAGVGLAGVSGTALTWLLLRRRQWSPRTSLLAGAVLTLCTCILGVGWVLPRYNERFSLRQHVLSVRDAMPAGSAIVCYPRAWDSVSFYLGRDDVKMYSQSERAELEVGLRHQDTCVLFLRDAADARDGRRLLAELSAKWTIEPIARQGPHQAVLISRPDRRLVLAGWGDSP